MVTMRDVAHRAGVSIATVSFVLFRQMLDAAAFVGIAMIVSGVVVINLFSGTTVH